MFLLDLVIGARVTTGVDGKFLGDNKLEGHLALPFNSLQKPFLSMDMAIYDYFEDTNTLKPCNSCWIW
jgi:hypothetical protein